MALALAVASQSQGGCWTTCGTLSAYECVQRCTEEPMSLAEGLALKSHSGEGKRYQKLGEGWSSGVDLHQGSVLGNRRRCEAICYNVCESDDCILTCTSKFCAGADDSEGFSWSYLLFAVVILLVLGGIVKVVFQKMVLPREIGDEGEAARYYHSI